MPSYLRNVSLRRVAGLLAAVGCLVAPAGARAASTFYIRGGGDGHGIGMSQYGADGYAQHGADYRTILTHYYQGTALGQISPARTVRVLLADGTASFSGASAAGGVALAPQTTYSATAVSSNRIRLQPAGVTLIAPVSVTGPASLQVPGQGTYRGALQLRPDGRGGVLTVNAVGLDDYVRGVVAAEMPASWPAAALQAQAVAARTYAITTGVGASAYDLYDDTRSQMYGGVGAETAATGAAVTATAGQVVTYDGQPAVTYFFASSGGYTESIQNVWPGATPEPWLTGVPDPYDNASGDPYHAWGQQMSIAAAQARLGSLVRGTLVAIDVTRHGVSPRILAAQVVGSAGTSTVTGAQLQQIFGLATADAAFTTISTAVSGASLTGSVHPARTSGGSVTVQQMQAGRWTTIAHPAVRTNRYAQTLPGAGRYRITYRGLGGPAVTQP
jgi:stage II sporulation protein D